MKRFLQRIKGEKGQSLVEFAIVLPILLIILGGIIDFGWIFYNNLAISNCTREGARFAVVNANEQDSVELIKTRIKGAAADNLKDNLTIDVKFTDVQNPSNGDVIIKVTGKIKVLTPIIGIFCEDQQIVLNSTAIMKVE